MALVQNGHQSKPGAIVLGGHVQGLGIIRSLGRRGLPVYLLDDTQASIGRFSKYCTKYFYVSAMKREDALVNFLTQLAAKERVQGWVIFPTHDATVEILSKNKDLLGVNYRISTPDWRITELAYNKKLTYIVAQRAHVPVPRTYFPKDEQDLTKIGRNLSYPVILKPAIMHKFYSRCKVKVYKASDLQELIRLYGRMCSIIEPREVMVQEIIPGSPQALFSFCCFYKDGEPKASCIGQRTRQIPMDFGKATTFVQSVEIPELRQYSTKLLYEISYYGLAEVEFKRDQRDGVYKLLEINPRSWKWHTMAIKAGLDMPYFLYSDLVGGDSTIGNTNVTGRLDVKWVDLFPDFYVAAKEIIKGKLGLRDYIHSLRGDIEFAVASRDDPWPAVAQFVLSPYFLFTR